MIIPVSFKRYGVAEEARRIARETFYPKLFPGLSTDPTPFPVEYLAVNLPQA